MTRARSEYLKAHVGCGVLCALIGSALEIDAAGQWALFAFGAVWGHFWLADERVNSNAKG
jgi:hypothetical protein